MPQSNALSEIGANFAYYMFQNCTTVNFPDDWDSSSAFTMPQSNKLTNVGANFAYCMFYGCANWEMNDIFNLPQSNVLTNVGASFAYGMFYNCTNLTMGAAFTMPQSNVLTSVGADFARAMFYECANFTMNDIFNLPQSNVLTSVGTDFARAMFFGCTSLEMNEVFNLPQGIASVGTNFAYMMFVNCTGTNFVINSVFKFPQLAPGEVDKTGVFQASFGNIGPSAQTRTIASIINGNPAPNTQRYTFSKINSGTVTATDTYRQNFMDWMVWPTNWGCGAQGGITADVISISLEEARALTTQESAKTLFGARLITAVTATGFTDGDISQIAVDETQLSVIQKTLKSGDFELKLSIPENTSGVGANGVREFLMQVTIHEEFRLKVQVSESDTFSIPLSSRLGDVFSHSYNWDISWGDGEDETVSDTNGGPATGESSAGISHTYDSAGAYVIKIKPHDPDEYAWFAAFGFHDVIGSTDANAQTNRNKITMVSSVLTAKMTRTAGQIEGSGTPPTHEWYAALYGCGNLTMGPYFNLPQDITAVSDSFAGKMFSGCTNLEMNVGFNLPQDITSVGDYFAASMFANCKAAGLINATFKFPALSQAQVNQTGVFKETFTNIGTSLQSQTIASIINGNPTPSAQRYTFSATTETESSVPHSQLSAFSDWNIRPYHWGCGGLYFEIAKTATPASVLQGSSAIFTITITPKASATITTGQAQLTDGTSVSTPAGGKIYIKEGMPGTFGGYASGAQSDIKDESDVTIGKLLELAPASVTIGTPISFTFTSGTLDEIGTVTNTATVYGYGKTVPDGLAIGDVGVYDSTVTCIVTVAEPKINVSVPVKLIFAAFQSDGGDIISPGYHIKNNAKTPVNVSITALTAMAAAGLTLTTADVLTENNRLNLYFAGKLKTASDIIPTDKLSLANPLNPAIPVCTLGAYDESGGGGDTYDFTFDGEYRGLFSPIKQPKYTITFKFQEASSPGP
jgi:hypothetical protein